MSSTRRDVLTILSAVALPTAVPAALPVAQDPDHLLRMICRAYCRLSVATSDLSAQLDLPDDQERPADLVERLRCLQEAMPTQEQIAEMPAHTLAGVRAKAEALSHWLLRNPDGTYLEGEELVGSVIEDLRRLT